MKIIKMEMAQIRDTFKLIVEYTWLTISVISIATATHSALKSGLFHKETMTFILMSIISFFMFIFRRNMRKRNP